MFIEAARIDGLRNATYLIGSEESGKSAEIDRAQDMDHCTTIASTFPILPRNGMDDIRVVEEEEVPQ